MGSVYILIGGKEGAKKTVNIKMKLSDLLEEMSSKGWKHLALFLVYKTISSLSEMPCDAHTSAQTNFHVEAHPACPLFHCLLL